MNNSNAVSFSRLRESQRNHGNGKNLHASIPNALLAQAEKVASAEDISVDEWLRPARERRLRESRPANDLSAEQRLQTLQDWAKSHAGNTIVLADDDMERESIYGDRGL